MAEWLDVADEAPRIGYTATASQTEFTVPFVFFDEDSLEVYQNDVLLELGADYTISGTDGFPSGIVTLLVGATAGDAIMIVRVVAVEQTTHFPPSGPFDIPALNIQFSRIVAMLQEAMDELDRAVTLPASEPSIDLELPTAADRANTALAFDVDGNVHLLPVVSGAVVPDAANITYTPVGAGSSARSVQSAFRDRMSVFDFIPSTQHTAISNASTSYDATADLLDSVEAADGADLHFPVGKFLTQGITRLTSVTDTWRNGMKLFGQGRGTNIVLTANSGVALKWDVGYVPDGLAATASKYTRDSEVKGMLITQSGGVTGGDGIRLTAAWDVRFTNVWVEGMSGKAVSVPWRSDIYATVSDYWQCFALDFQQCRFSESTDWGVNFSGGQSPGLWRMQHCTIANNAGGGVYTTTGQFVFTDNLIVGNGTYGGSGGMIVDAAIEGVSFNALVERNEFDTNFNYHLWMLRCRNHRYIGNRFLSQTYDSDTGSTLTSGSAFMRPATHVKLSDGSADEVWNCLFEENYHRSVTGAGPTTATVLAYVMTGGSTEVKWNRFINNDIGSRDGVNQNSSGMLRYNNLNLGVDANSIVDGNLVGLSATASVATSVTGTATVITFGGTQYDTHSAWSSPTFTAPVAARYKIVSTVPISGLSVGNIVTVDVYVNAAQSRASTHYAGGLATQSFMIDVDILLAETDAVTIRATQNSGSAKNTIADSNTRLNITQIS